jgi:hypothetical protein
MKGLIQLFPYMQYDWSFFMSITEHVCLQLQSLLFARIQPSGEYPGVFALLKKPEKNLEKE